MHCITASLDRKLVLIVKRLHPEMAFRIFPCVSSSKWTPLSVPYQRKLGNTNDSWLVEILLRGTDRIDLSTVQA